MSEERYRAWVFEEGPCTISELSEFSLRRATELINLGEQELKSWLDKQGWKAEHYKDSGPNPYIIRCGTSLGKAGVGESLLEALADAYYTMHEFYEWKEKP
jgi:hypothetical protein